jgi:hypothetical protein
MLNKANKQSGDDPIEQLLDSFKPSPANIDRDQIMFLAGMRAAQALNGKLPALTLRARLRDRLWPALAIVSTAAAVTLAIIAWQRPERIVVVERPAEEKIAQEQPPQSPPQLAVTPDSVADHTPTIDPASNYLHRRDLILRDGPEALPAQPGSGSYVARNAPTQRELLKEMPGDLQHKFQVDSEAWWQSWLISGDRL